MTVRETIKVRSAGKKIKRGIYRDFPTRYKDKLGNRYVVGFTVRELLRDGKPETYHTENLSNGKRIRIGKRDVYLPPGDYTYTITYETNRQLGFFEDHDELYWNVTGNGWEFPIEEASATVELPAGIPRSSLVLEGYTGPEDSTASDLVTSIDDSGHPAFHTTKPLKSQEGLTIVAAWPKGFVTKPPRELKPERKIEPTRENESTRKLKSPHLLMQSPHLLMHRWGTTFGLIGVLGIIGYYSIVWAMVGKDPAKGTVIPLFKPPKGFSPAAMRYITRMGYDNKAFTAALINMAAKGFVKIREKDRTYTIVKTRTETKGLAPEEKKIAAKLLRFKTLSEIKLKQKNHAKIGRTVKALKKSLKVQFETKYFVTNRKYFAPGIVFSIIILILTGLFSAGKGNTPIVLFMSLWLSGWSVGVIFLSFTAASSWKTVIQGSGNRLTNLGGAIFLTLFALPFWAGEVFGLSILAIHSSVLVIVFLAAIVFINCLFYHLLKAPTRAGRNLLDKIEGFKMYIGVAEKERLNLLNPPEKTPELFERYLPYALALDVENAWAEQFSEILAKAGQAETEYSPSWYSGTSWSGTGPGNFASSFGNSFSSAIASSSTAPGSSSGLSGGGGGGFSGGGGGGSSGGGGGGGGGGGW